MGSNQVCALLSLALLLGCSAAQREFFKQLSERTWDQAREHCQACFIDLVTVSPQNTQTVSQNLTSDHWIGLRQNFNSTIPWSRWANGDPIAFQNWYPGRPLLQPICPCFHFCMPSSSHNSCSSSSNSNSSISSNGSISNNSSSSNSNSSISSNGSISNNSSSSNGSISSNSSSSNSSSNSSISNNSSSNSSISNNSSSNSSSSNSCSNSDVYVEDSCVAMLSIGAWVEKACVELLPYICYDDRFLGRAEASDVTTGSAVLTWQPGPSNVSHYRLEVKGDTELRENLTDLTYNLDGLTAGTQYSVQVFPVKCGRDLNPQEVAFCTTPNKVINLSATVLSDTSIALNWSRPAGNLDFYFTKWKDVQIQNTTEGLEVDDLTPGSLYKFTVFSGVKDKSKWSEESHIEAYTKPGRPSDLKASKNTNNSMQLQWVAPTRGNYTGFRVMAAGGRNNVQFDETATGTSVNITGLSPGSEITLSVRALANGTLEGEEETLVSYTTPGPVSNLRLTTSHDSLIAAWDRPTSSYTSFNILLKLDGPTVKSVSTTELRCSFAGLKNTAKYVVMVSAVKGDLEGPAVTESKFTLPLPPTDAKITSFTKDQATLQWKAPAKAAATLNYSVEISSSFWGHNWTEDVVNKTSLTFRTLRSGTKYKFAVRTAVGDEMSAPSTTFTETAPNKMEIGLSMLCSAEENLLCDAEATRERIFKKLEEHFRLQFHDNIFWKLNRTN